MYPGGFFQYNKDPNNQIFAIRRYDQQEGKIEEVVGSGCRPQLSRDGKKLAFVRRMRTSSVLLVHNLATGEEFPLWDGLSKDQQEAWTIFGSYTGFDWLPDNKHVVIWGKGKIWKVDAETGKATEIPFQVNAKHRLAETVRFENQVFKDQFDVKVIRQAKTRTDGKLLVFNEAGYLWKKTLPDGKRNASPKALT